MILKADFNYTFILLMFVIQSIGISPSRASSQNLPSATKNNIYVLVVGLSGSGKSTMINLMFNTTLAKVGSSQSTTTEIFEYSLTLPNDNNTELRLIDTPGMEDTGGLENDAKFLATLEEFLKNHDELRFRPPDVVLICARFDDNRFHGENSKFVKMLRGLGILVNQQLNSKYSNLIFVMTHLMGVPIKEAKNPTRKISQIETAIKEFSLFPSPYKIVLAENKGDDQDLERVEFGHKLPNGEIYPQNLCNSIESVLKLDTNNDDKRKFIGTACNRVDSSSIISLVSKVELVQLGDIRASKILQLLFAANFKTEDTEISQKLAETMPKLQQEKLPADSLIFLQRALHHRLITKIKDIPTTNVEIATLFRQLKRVKEVGILMKATFGVQAPNLPFHLLVGNSYDVSSDSVMQSTVFETENEAESHSEMGYMVPSWIITTKDVHDKIFYEKFSSEEDYIKNRAFSLGIDRKHLLKETNGFKPGMNVITRRTCPSLLMEFRTAKFVLDEVELSASYLSKLQDIPNNLNISVPSSVQQWDNFLKLHGTHVIVSAHCGGSIEVTFDSYSCDSPDMRDIIKLYIATGQKDVLESIGGFKSLKISGGNQHLHSDNPETFFGGGEISLFERWKDSLVTQPTILYNGLKLKPVSEFIRDSETGSAEKLTDAIHFFLEELPDVHPLMSKIVSVNEEKEDLHKNIQYYLSENANLESVVEQHSKLIHQMENNTFGLSNQLLNQQQSISDLNLSLLYEKGTSQSLRYEVNSMKTSADLLQNRIKAEEEHSKQLMRNLESANSRVATLLNEVNLATHLLMSCKYRQG